VCCATKCAIVLVHRLVQVVVQVGRLDRALSLCSCLVLALCPPSTSVSSVFMLLCMFKQEL